LHQFRLRGDSRGHVGLYFGLIAAGVRAAVPLLAKVIAKQQLVVAGTLGTLRATSSRRHELRIAFVEWRVFQNEQDVRVNPELQVADRQQDTGWLLAVAVVNLFETCRESLFLLVGRQLRQ